MPLKIPAGRIGEWKHPRYGTIKMTQQMFDDIKRNFKEKTIGRDPFIRIGHDKADDPTFGGAKAEGWITDIVQEGDHLFVLAEPTNEHIADMVKSKQYRYASPEYQENYKSKEDGSLKGAVLEALALTNEPFLTRLPEARLLSDPPETFYLDHEEVVNGMDKEILEGLKQNNTLLSTVVTKLSDWFSGKREEQPTPPGSQSTPPAVNEETKKLSEQVAALQVENRKIAVEATIAQYVSKGIPPAVLEQYRPILLADSGEKVIKLSDDKLISVSEQIYAALDTFPEAGRVKLSQMGHQETPPAAGSPEELKKLADEDMAALGYRKDDQGRYVL